MPGTMSSDFCTFLHASKVSLQARSSIEFLALRTVSCSVLQVFHQPSSTRRLVSSSAGVIARTPRSFVVPVSAAGTAAVVGHS